MKKLKLFPAERMRDMRELVQRAAKKYNGVVAYKQYDENGDIVVYTFRQLLEDMNALGTVLTNRGYSGKHFAVIGESSYEWILSYLAVVNGVGVIVPIDKELPNDDIAKLINKADVDGIFFSKTFEGDMEDILSKCPRVKTTIILNPSEGDTKYLSQASLIDEGKALVRNGNKEYINAGIDPEVMSVIIFTSGTTGANKGVMLSHKNIMTSLHSAFTMHRFEGTSISVLPIHHTYEFNLNVLGCIYAGVTLCINDSLKHVMPNLQTYKPTFSLMVPLIVENIYKNIWREAEKSGLAAHMKQGIWFSNILRKFGIDRRRYYFKPVLDKFGGEINMIVSGAAPLRPEVVKGLDDLGISVYNGYGITECSPLVAFNCELLNVPGSVGRPIPDVQVRIAEPDEKGIGEIQVLGDNVMIGFYKDEEATKATFTDDGWFKTGDLGKFGKKGVLEIMGRQKNLIILANGKNVHPEELEDYLMDHIP
ncbi:MAG: AMP-binding protein, partial [Clostridia bacterium]|nr:AMP-binding protein [Clostridia bacterium]